MDESIVNTGEGVSFTEGIMKFLWRKELRDRQKCQWSSNDEKRKD